MIYLTVMGRCGNQMFQYAFARRYAEIRGDDLTINFGDLHSYTEKSDPSFRDELSQFQAVHRYEKIETKEDLVMHFGSFRQKTVWKLYRLVRKFYGKLGVDPKKANTQFRFLLSACGIFIDTKYREKSFPMKKIREKNLFMRGYFEDPAYFESITEELQSDLVPLSPVEKRNEPLYDIIRSRESVCVSFRKWEVGGREICGEDYYRKAFAYMAEKIENPAFIIFSNDVEWVKEHFALPEGCFFEEGKNSIPEKVRLMSGCRHFILSNSTFAWWAQFLGRSKDKIVVSPEKWFERETRPDLLLMKEFVRL